MATYGRYPIPVNEAEKAGPISGTFGAPGKETARVPDQAGAFPSGHGESWQCRRTEGAP